jgi:hypothetical protein
MAVTEFQRHEVFKWLEERMGPERAAIMMDLLPPVGWGDIVTTRDLEAFESRMTSEFASVRSELRSEMHGAHASLLLRLFFGLVASNATLVGLVFAAVRLG